MSLLVGTIADDTALVIVDTDSTSADLALGATKHQPAPKVYPLFIQRAVITGRGSIGVIATVANYATCAMLDFDALADVMPLLCKRAWLHSATLATYIPSAPPMGAASIHLVGWSRSAQRMRAWQYTMPAGDPTFSAESVEPLFAAPVIDGQRLEFGVPSMRAYVAAQLRWMRDTFPDEASGGPIICATITRDMIALADLGVIEPARPRQSGLGAATVAGGFGA